MPKACVEMFTHRLQLFGYWVTLISSRTELFGDRFEISYFVNNRAHINTHIMQPFILYKE